MDVVSLFSGCGGSDLGFKKAKYDIIFANDINTDACETYYKNIKIMPINRDIRLIDHFPKADVLIGCCPCQGFSIYGKRMMEDPRNYLYLQFSRALKDVDPTYFVSENVKGILFGYGKEILKKMLASYRQRGYKTYLKLINAKYYGVPQDRERLFIVGIKKGINKKYEFPNFTHGEGLDPFVTLNSSIGNLNKPNSEEIWEGTFSSHYMSRNRRRDWEQSSFTIQSSGRHAPLHPSSPIPIKVEKDKYIFPESIIPPRRMSYLECAIIQSFPKDYKFVGTLESKYAQIGNAVPPLVSQKIAESLLYF